jgi:3-oxoacyl-(acyl-carrier-protein) synthase
MKSGATPAQMWSQVPTANKIVSVIKSIQRGTISMTGASATATVTAVVLAKSVVLWGGSDFNVAGGYTDATDAFAKMVLTNTTTVTTSRLVSAGACTLSYQVVEYN